MVSCLKLINYLCSQKPINDDYSGQGEWILIPNKTPDKTPPGFHLRWNMFFIWDQTLALKENSWKQCNTRETMSLQNVLLFHLRRHVKNSGLVLHHGLQTARTEMKALTRICFGPYKGIQDSLASWIPYRGFQIPGTGFQSLSVELGFGLQSLVGFWIPWVVFRIPKSMIPDSTSKFSQIPDSGYWIPVFFSGTLILDCNR